MKTIQTGNAPAAIGPYTQAIQCGELLFISGQIGLNPESGAAAGDSLEAQAEQCCRNVSTILEAAGSCLKQVVKTTCFLVDMGDFPAFNGVYEKYFIGKPARSCVAVRALPKGMRCEIEAIALIPR